MDKLLPESECWFYLDGMTFNKLRDDTSEPPFNTKIAWTAHEFMTSDNTIPFGCGVISLFSALFKSQLVNEFFQ